MSEKSNLKKSEEAVGQLRPVILSKSGKVVDGLHRLDANPKWGTEIHDDIVTEEDYWKSRAHLNYTRRNAIENRQEKLKIINSLAEYYVGQGLSIEHHDHDAQVFPLPGPKNQVLKAIINTLDGAIPEGWIKNNLDKKYLQTPKRPAPDPKKKLYKDTPEQAIRSRFGTDRAEHAEQVIADLKTEVREDIKEQVREEVVTEVREEAKEELRRDPDFIIEAAETAIEVLPTLEPKVLTPDGVYKPALTEIQRKQLLEAVEERERKDEERRTGEDSERLKKIGKYVTIEGGLRTIAAVLDRVKCPETDNPAETDLIFKESGLTIREAISKCGEILEELRK